MSKQAEIKEADIPPDYSAEACDFANKCLQRKPIKRLGCNGIDELKNHPWFHEFDWEALYYKKMESPFIPLVIN